MGLSLTEVVGACATVTTIGQFLSGSFTARKVWRMGTAGDLSPVPFIAAVLGSSLWCLYGVLLQDATIVYTNLAGITLNTFYVFVFYLYTPKKVVLTRQVFLTLTTIAVLVLYIRSLTDIPIAKNQLGLLCTVVSLASCASPLVALQHVIKTKSTETLPFPLILSVFFVCFQWYVYGVLIDDFYMQTTNLLGTLISIVQLSLFLIYPSHHSQPTKGRSESQVL